MRHPYDMKVRRQWIVLPAVLVVGLAGLGMTAREWFLPLMSQQTIVQESDKFVLYSLLATAPPDHVKAKGQFHGYGILGEKEIAEPKLKAQLVDAFRQGLEVPEDYAPGDCFFPNHAIRAIKGGRTVDAVLCYSCGSIKFYENGEQTRVPTLREPGKVFEKAVIDAKLTREADLVRDWD